LRRHGAHSITDIPALAFVVNAIFKLGESLEIVLALCGVALAVAAAG
jgi:hypothetical protein